MVIALVPARCGSKSIEMKNIKNFCGKPLAFWVLNALQNSKTDVVYVATDCDTVKESIKSLGFPKVHIYDRESINASDESSTESVMLEFIENKRINADDVFILAQATSPFTTAEDIDLALQLYRKECFDSVLSCTRIKRFFWSIDGQAINFDYRNRPRRQDFEGTFMENGALYVNSVGNIVKYKNRLCGRIGIYEMDSFKSIELDEMDDWLIAEKLMKQHMLI